MEQDHDAIYAFDTLYTNQQIQMLKLAMPLLPPLYRSFLAVYIRFLELSYTIHSAGKLNFSGSLHERNEDYSLDAQALDRYFQSIMPYMNETDKAGVQKIKNMFQTMEQFKQMRPILEMMSQNPGSEQSDDNYMDILKGFLSEDQLFMFDMFNSQVNNPTKT